MPYPFDETFASGIPAGFGANGGAGGITATWNAAAQVVDLVFTSALNFWKITAAEQASDFWFEMDVEIVAATALPFFGFWLLASGTYEGHRLAVYEANLYLAYRNAAGASDGEIQCSSATWATVGSRKTLRLDVKLSAEGVWDYRLSVDGTAVWAGARVRHSSFLPCVFGYGTTLRLHRAAGGLPSALGDAPALAQRVLPVSIAQRILVADHAAALVFKHSGLRGRVGTRNHYYYGRARIAGTVKEKGVVVDLPVRRRVLLFDERANFVVRETWSDAATGAYAFEYLNPEVRYLVMAYDHQQNFRATVADNLTAEPMP